jgi:hypothetical protein
MHSEALYVAEAVSLTPVEMQQAAMIGVLRQIESIRLRLKDSFGADPDNGWSLNIEGAAGEMAVAKILDLYWGMPVNTFKRGGDVGHIQVRTRSRHHSELIVRPGDRDDDVFVLVTGRSPHFQVHGYIAGGQAKQRCWLHGYGGRPPAYFVPQSALHPLQLLKSWRENSQADATANFSSAFKEAA